MREVDEIKDWIKKHKIASAVIAFFIIVWITTVTNPDYQKNLQKNKEEQKQQQEAAAQNVTKPEENKVEVPTQTYLEISCKDYVQKFGVKSNLSDLQKDALFDQEYKDKLVRWNGEVVAVADGFWGGYTLQVKCDPATFISDVIVDLDDSQKDQLLKYGEGQNIKFEGKLDSWGQLLPSGVKEGKIIE